MFKFQVTKRVLNIEDVIILSFTVLCVAFQFVRSHKKEVNIRRYGAMDENIDIEEDHLQQAATKRRHLTISSVLELREEFPLRNRTKIDEHP
jgi:hypothetical protein